MTYTMYVYMMYAIFMLRNFIVFLLVLGDLLIFVDIHLFDILFTASN